MSKTNVPTLAQQFRDAVWEADPDELSPTEALILLAYADHARGGDTAWVAQSRLMQRCKIRSKDTPSRVIAGLVAKGWLVLLAPAQWRNRKSPTYRLAIPISPMNGEMTSPMNGEVGDRKSPRSTAGSPRSVAESPRLTRQTSPMSGAYLPDDRVPLSSERPSGLSGEGEAPPPLGAGGAPPEDQTPAPLPPGEARAAALAIAAASKSRDVIISHWRQPPPAEPNPSYNPTRAAAAARELPVFEFSREPADELEEEASV